MPWQPRRLRLESLENRRLLAAVSIPDDLTGQVGAQVAAPVLIDSAQGIRGAEIRIQYDPALLTLTSEGVTAGSAWGGAEDTQVIANVDQATGTVIVFIATPAGLPDVGGSLVIFAFGVRDSAQPGAETVIDLVGVRLNEGAIAVTPAPVPGADPSDGRIIIVGGEPGLADRIAGFVYADTNNDNLPGEREGIPGVEITLINLQTNAQQRTTTQSSGAFEFTGLTAGSYRIIQTQPLAYLDGGLNTVNVELAAGLNLNNQNFRELGLRPQFVYNRLLTTTTLPVGSTAWIAVLEQINVDAASGTVAPAGSASTLANTLNAAALSAESQPVVVTSQSVLADGVFSPPASSPEGELLADASMFPQHPIAPPAPGLITDQDDKEDVHAYLDQALTDLGLW